MGAMHLCGEAIKILRSKGHRINSEEAEAVTIAILLHDIGHGPFSHALEHSIVSGVNHEVISALIMDQLNVEFRGKLSLALKIFRNKYHRKFLHQLVSSQLDVDRLDYLMRDSFYSGVSEGVISSDRIIETLEVVNGELAVEAKGIYSIEKFIIARRLMYWQVYLHKTVIAGEYLLVNILRRAKELAKEGQELFATPAFRTFLYNEYKKKDFIRDPEILKTFSQLDDYDIFASVKVWTNHKDKVLSMLCRNLVSRHLFKTELQNTKFSEERIASLKKKVINLFKLQNSADADYFVFSKEVTNNAYNPSTDKINLLFRDGKVMDIAEASDQLNISVLATQVKKYFLCYPKECR